jgi:hypothetical protein
VLEETHGRVAKRCGWRHQLGSFIYNPLTSKGVVRARHAVCVTNQFIVMTELIVTDPFAGMLASNTCSFDN